MNKRPKTILYLSDDSDTEYEDDNTEENVDLPVECEEAIVEKVEVVEEVEKVEAKLPLVEEPIQKINGRKVIKKEHIRVPTEKSMICKHCKRVYIQKHTFEKHENEKCPVLQHKKKQEAELILRENEKILAKAKRSEYLKKKKEEADANRPIQEIVIKKKRGAKLKPEIIVTREPKTRVQTTVPTTLQPQTAFKFSIG